MFRQNGKPSGALVVQKSSFFHENRSLVARQKEMSEIYRSQPLRKVCKNCSEELSQDFDFIKNGIGYKICRKCSHLNGGYQDTDKFCEAIYTSDGGEEYAKNYTSKDVNDYTYRVGSIYIPKAEFLYTSLKNEKLSPNDLSYFDFGSGSGYFVDSLLKIGIKNVFGSDVSSFQANFGNKMIGKDVLKTHTLDKSVDLLSDIEADVVSMIGVLEHLQQPREVLKAIQKNSHIKYFFISVPIFSLTIYIELLSDEMFHRHLNGGHTHLYTDSSLKYMMDEFGFELVSEWWFGADIMDLYRTLLVNLEKRGVSDFTKELFRTEMTSLIDPIQVELDKKNLSSEVHMLLKKRDF
jgi:2-polyprenyl-3-methyl-5-hydroxy-6-metoxy-1,4-benzoquinol methylase